MRKDEDIYFLQMIYNITNTILLIKIIKDYNNTSGNMEIL
jgi:hypothetical protein